MCAKHAMREDEASQSMPMPRPSRSKIWISPRPPQFFFAISAVKGFRSTSPLTRLVARQPKEQKALNRGDRREKTRRSQRNPSFFLFLSVFRNGPQSRLTASASRTMIRIFFPPVKFLLHTFPGTRNHHLYHYTRPESCDAHAAAPRQGQQLRRDRALEIA